MKKALVLLMSLVFFASIIIACTKSDTPSSSSVPNESPKATVPVSPSPSAPAVTVPAATGEKVFLVAGGPDDKFGAAWADYGGFFKTNLFRRLLVLNEKVEPVGKDLAKEFTVSPDGLTYTFTLRDDVKWHDGVKFTADDVKWSLGMALKSASINAVFSGAFIKIAGADDWKTGKATDLKGVTIEGSKVTIQLTEPVGVFQLVMAQWPPYPKHLLEKEDPSKLHLSSFWEKPIGNGAYMLTEVQPNNYAVMEIFKDYYGPKPKIEKIKLQTMTEDKIVTKSQANQLDYMQVMSLDQVNEALKNPAYKAYPVDIFFDRYLQANMTGSDGKGNKKIADLKIRQALLYAIDRKALADKLFKGQAELLETKIPTKMPEFNQNVVKYAFDAAKAKQLLNEANFDFNQTIKLQYYYTDQQSVDLIDTIKYYWEQIGVKVEASLMKGNLLELIYTKRDYDFLYAGLSAMSLEEAYGLFHTDSPLGMQVLGGAKDKWDPLINDLRRESDPQKRKAAVGKLQEMESQFLWHMPLFSIKQYILVNEARLKTSKIFGNEWTNYDRKQQDWELLVK
ncbi:ABC transporter substrate-binding protein [Paenibacillus agricola]|uniref:ABC transporter substrate-binding protein n=1 Tax=Paenibacillus agricola TaxID=2716264 RepID=A0ABX0JBM2_9BACL|nr:ABC transporter substrate-binding protein [Paenibacillus agricola]NHN32770.1 ABC transporter substrate-binding protein [Paenibacillus agricola]